MSVSRDVSVCIPKYVCLFVPGYSCVNTEAHAIVCCLGRVHACQGPGLYRIMLMCMHLAVTHAWIQIRVCGPVLCRCVHTPVCTSVGTGVDKKCMPPSVLAFVHGYGSASILTRDGSARGRVCVGELRGRG